jgi:iron complex outermembrane receptor protein
MNKSQGVVTILCVGLLASASGPAAAVSEQDFFTEMPEVLSVSRLAQPLNETPGAVTVIDREMIRRSGARTVAELLRLVPGFIVSHFEGGARPMATYHAEYDGIVRHLQVFVDGRSVYSSLLVGSAAYGMLAVVLEDVERIEVLRGSNSAAYGANAFLGVINIVTRHAADSRGGMVSVSAGDGGVNDSVARIGWGDERAVFRVTAASRADHGFDKFNDSNRLDQVHLRGDLQPTAADDVTVTAGHAAFGWGVQPSATEKRDESWRNSYARLQWTRRLNATDQVQVGATVDEERYRDFFPLLRADGISRRTELEAQHSFSAAGGLRLVWGGQYHREQVDSPDLFADQPVQRFDLWRAFGNAEWKPHPDWVINVGGMYERHSIIGDRTAPRLMVNYHLLPGQTLRAGTTTAYKQPTLFELRADWRLGDTPVILARGAARPERVDATELGYLGEFRSLGVTADVRAFQEKVKDLLRYERPCGNCGNDLVNKDPNTQRGWETQLRWQPVEATQLLLNHTELRLVTEPGHTAPQDVYRAPRHFSTLAWFQRLPGDFELTVIHSRVAEFFYVRKSDMIPAYRQTDLRLGRRFLLGSTRAEAAVSIQAADGGHADYVQRSLPAMILDRRAVASLRLEF